MYYFGKDKAEQAKVLSHTIAGGMSINDIGVQFACDDMPFGGIGSSGIVGSVVCRRKRRDYLAGVSSLSYLSHVSNKLPNVVYP